MQRVFFTVASASAVVICGLLWAQPKTESPPKPTAQDMQEHMERMVELARPGPLHKALTDRAGQYDLKVRFWPDAENRAAAPIESTGEATLRPALDGRFLMHEETLTLAGQPTRAIKYWGYSKDTERFEAVWSYTGSTSMMILTGASADGGKTVRYTSDAVSAGRKDRFEITTTQVSPDEFTVELVGTMENGAKGAAMVSTYTRKK